MDIKTKKIYHCASQDDVRQFLTQAKNKGFVWKNEMEIDVERDIAFYDKYKNQTCFKTNLGKMTFGAYDGYKADNPDREIIEYTAIEVPTKIFTADKNSIGIMIYTLYNDGYRARHNGFDLSKSDITEICKTLLYTNQTIMVLLFDDKSLKFSFPDCVSSYGWDDKINEFVQPTDIPKVNDFVMYGGAHYIISRVDYSMCKVMLTSLECGHSSRFYVDFYDYVKNPKISQTSEFSGLKPGDIFCVSRFKAWFKHIEKVGNYNICQPLAYQGYYNICYGDSYCALPADVEIENYGNNPTNDFVKDDIVTISGVGYRTVTACYDKIIVCSNSDGNEICYVRNKYTISKAESPIPTKTYTQVVDSDRLDKMVNNVIGVFKEHGYAKASEVGVRKFLEKWNTQKSWLANLLRKSPDWDEENLCVTKIVDDIRYVDYYSRVSAMSAFARTFDSAYSNKFYTICSDDATHCLKERNPVVDEEFLRSVKRHITDGEVKINIGAKLTRAIRQICVHFGWDKQVGFEKAYAELTDIITTKVDKRKYCLSINPIDFLLMSNGNSWSSCHYLEYGNTNKCYQAGTMSYPVDNVSMIFFSLPEDATGELCKQKKLRRQIFCYDGRALLQSRLYPKYDAVATSNDIRAWVLGEFCKAEGDDHMWDAAFGHSYIPYYFDTRKYSTHYPDYEYSDYNCKVIPRKGLVAYDYSPFVSYIGDKTICPVCGNEHYDDKHTCYCRNCR